MNIFQRLFKRKTSADKIADARREYFNKFVGTPSHDYTSGWCGATPDEAMHLTDRIVAWLYSEPPHRSSGSNGTYRG